MSLLPVVREMIPFGREELTSQVPKECFLSNHQQSSYSPLGLEEIVFFGSDTRDMETWKVLRFASYY